MAIKTFTTGEVLTASDTNTFLANSGLVHIASLTATYGTTTALNFDNVFTSSYENYRVVVGNMRLSAITGPVIRMRVGGVNNSAASYFYAQVGLYYNGTAANNNGASVTEWNTGAYCDASGLGFSTLAFDIFGPAITQRTIIHTTATGLAGSAYMRLGGGLHDNTSAFDGFTIYPFAGGTMGTRVSVYGYRIP